MIAGALSRGGISTLPNHIGRVLPVSPEPEVVWVAAQWRVARVADKARVVGWNLAFRKFVGNATGMHRAAVKPELPVAVTADVAQPWPALVGASAIDARPESLCGIGALVVIAAPLRAVLADLRDVIAKFYTTARAGLHDFLGSDIYAMRQVATSGAMTSRFTWATRECHPATIAGQRDSRGVVLAKPGVPFWERHIHKLYSRRTQ